MKAIILEDELIASNRLKRMLEALAPDIKVVKIFESIRDTAEYLLNCEEQPDILFIDIHVVDGNSFELFNIVDVKSKVIFTTAYDEYAVKAFRKNATDYLLKPIKRELLEEAITRATPIDTSTSVTSNEFKSRFLIRFGSKLHSVKTQEIAYIFSKNKISYFYTFDGQRFPSDYKLQQLESMLDPNRFYRANRQFIVNIESIADMARHDASRVKLSLNPVIDEKIIVSTEKTRDFKRWLDR